MRRAVTASEESTRSIPYNGLTAFQTKIAPGHKTPVVLISWDLRLGPQSQPASKQHTQHRTWGPQAPKSNPQRSTHTANQKAAPTYRSQRIEVESCFRQGSTASVCERSHPHSYHLPRFKRKSKQGHLLRPDGFAIVTHPFRHHDDTICVVSSF